METFSALLALCAGNSPVNGDIPTQRPVTRSFDVFFDLRLNKQVGKQSWGWWSETPTRSSWRQSNGLPLVIWNIINHFVYAALGQTLNIFCPNDAVWCRKTWLSLVEVMACCHYCNLCRLMLTISGVLWHWQQGNFISNDTMVNIFSFVFCVN